jgi:rRNA maturation RNase YbeY
LSINFYYEDIKLRIADTGRIKRLIREVIEKEKRISGDLSFIFTTDQKIIEINRKFLNRNYFTDVITFDYSGKKIISGDIFISVETVKRNSVNYKVSFRDEILRVIIHGVLHLLKYKDSNSKERKEMRRMEDHWIEYFKR